ncbi:MAG: hypothetical protein Q7J29_13685 [Stagnimonas sp.]|nr:hypothetical protein [Stagnimonas sp.]
MTRFTKTVWEIEFRLADSGDITLARDWIAYRKREAAEWEGVRQLAEDYRAPLARQQAAAPRLGELTVKAERQQLDVPTGRIRRALYEFQRPKLDGGRLLLAVCAEIGLGNGPLPFRKQLAEQFGVTPQAIHKRLPAAQRDLLAVAQIAALPWEPASAPGDLDTQREDLHRCVLTAALVRWDWPSEPACELTDSEVAQAAQGLASRSEKET